MAEYTSTVTLGTQPTGNVLIPAVTASVTYQVVATLPPGSGGSTVTQSVDPDGTPVLVFG